MVGGAFCVKGSVRGIEYNNKDKSVSVSSNGLIIDENKDKKELAKDVEKQFRAYESKYTRANATDLRAKIVISPDKEQGNKLSVKDWQKLEQDYYKKMGINPDNHARYSKLHTDTKIPHLHIEISCVNFQGERAIKSQKIGEKTGKALSSIAKERGWKTAKEIGDENKKNASISISEILQKAKDFQEFKAEMSQKGYEIKISENEAKGVYGLRIIPKDQYTENPSPRKNKSGQGYKLSELQKNEQSKAKWNIAEIKNKMEENKKAQMQNQEQNRPQSQQANQNDYFEKLKVQREQKQQEQNKNRGFRR